MKNDREREKEIKIIATCKIWIFAWGNTKRSQQKKTYKELCDQKGWFLSSDIIIQNVYLFCMCQATKCISEDASHAADKYFDSKRCSIHEKMNNLSHLKGVSAIWMSSCSSTNFLILKIFKPNSLELNVPLESFGQQIYLILATKK